MLHGVAHGYASGDPLLAARLVGETRYPLRSHDGRCAGSLLQAVLSLAKNRREYAGNNFQEGLLPQVWRRWYFVPLTLLGVLSAWGLYGTAGTLKVWTGATAAGDGYTIPDVALGAFLGGLTWVVSDQLTRFRDRDFTSFDVYNGVFRLLIAVPLGYSLASFGNPSLKISIAFILGAFPTSTLFTIARRLGAKQFGLGDDAVKNSTDSELEKLQSVGKETAERLCDEGISSIGALAWTDPIDLTIRTNLEFSFVVDCISQALLWIYTHDDTPQLYVLSLRGAQEVAAFIDDLQSPDALTQAEAEKTLEEAAARVKVPKEAFHQTLLEVAQDPSTKFLVKIWADSN
jgi:hypothetical protein